MKNTGSKVTEFYLYAEDGKRIVGEVENIGPGLSRSLVVNAPAGKYVPACKPGMTGKGIRSTFTVTESGEKRQRPAAAQQQVDAADAQYHEYVEDQAEELLDATKQFVAAYKAGDDDEARALYPTARVHWERIEPVAESFGDLDPKMDVREADLEAGPEVDRLAPDREGPVAAGPAPATGDTPLTKAQRATYADELLADTKTLHGRSRS